MTKTLIALGSAAALAMGAQVFAAQPQDLPPQAAHGQDMAQSHNAPACPGPADPDSARCHARVVTDGHGAAVTNTTPVGYGPAQLQTAYGVLNNVGQKTIGIVDAYDDPNIERDLATYSTQFGLPTCTTQNGCFKKVGQTGTNRYPRGNQGWALEISLDVEVAHATCPGCKILLVEANSANFSDLLVAEDYAAAHANVVSNSWGANEFNGETTYDSHFNHPGVPIVVSSGDNGYGVEYPAASRFVTAVGGTNLQLNANNTRASEVVWSGAGSGCSTYEAKPTWQTDTGCSKRTVADVSAVADPATGAAVYDSYGYSGQSGWFKVGGTSLAAPLVASIYAIAGNGVAPSYPYANAGAFFDITAGSNGNCGTYLCNAAVGYDGPTGLGTPVGVGGL